MNTINLEGKSDTPKILFDPENDIFEISGRSLPEDATVFYEPILDWLNAYAENPNNKTVVHFKLNYFNTASSKMLLDILLIFEELSEKNDVLIKWFYPEDDEDMQEAGEEYDEIVEVDFEHIPYN